MGGAHWPRQGEAAEPAPDGRTWPCGHPLTEANSKDVGGLQPRCRICRRRIERESFARRHQREEA